MIDFQARPGSTDDVVFARDRASGRIRLNRPQAINALTWPMVVAITDQLREWTTDDDVQNVVIDGAGDRGLCAGGDIKTLHRAILDGDREALGFWPDEYAMNATIANFRKPIVSLMDGIVMGGGVGLAGFCSLRVVTERSQVAMPETGIGFFPDVGARFLLSRTDGVGTHLALTGTTVGAGDAIAAGLADVAMTDAEIATTVEILATGGSFKKAPGAVPGSSLSSQPWIAECYEGHDITAILQRLESHADPAARAAGALIRTRCPLSVAVTLDGLRRAEHMTLVEVLDDDAVLAAHFAEAPDFVEGVRAQLVDKDRNPQWQHARVEDVTAEEVAAFFRDPVPAS